MQESKCRHCSEKLTHSFCDLGKSPLSNSYLHEDDLNKGEMFYPLHAYVCSNCFLVQLEQYEAPDKIFSDYQYFSSYSSTWLKHCEKYEKAIVEKLKLNQNSLVVEIASNDGYLLQYFSKDKIPVLGIEPAANVAKFAQDKGIDTCVLFFGEKTAEKLVSEGRLADLIIANNVLAHVPDINDFVKGLKRILKKKGTITLEFPHLLNLIKESQFDTIYHEHFSYLSLLTTESIFRKLGLKIYDVEKLDTHGGSLRIYATHIENEDLIISNKVRELEKEELTHKLNNVQGYCGFQEKAIKIKNDLLLFLLKCKNEEKKIAAYGAPAKGNTLLNYCGIKSDLIEFTVDISPHKQGFFLPGTGVPIYNVEKLIKIKPDYILILPWNLKDEIVTNLKKQGVKNSFFLCAIPDLRVIK